MSLSNLEEVSVASVLTEEQTAPTTPVIAPTRSYRPYPWKVANQLLDLVDDLTGGRAGMIQRLGTYVFIGGLAALANLFFFFVFNHYVPIANDQARNVFAFICATEISILVNFGLNDYFTFRHMDGGRDRSRLQRCWRFHLTSVSGSVLTFLIQFGLSQFAHVWPFFAQAIALILVLFYNFSAHHFFTYRRVKKVASAE
ncbi:GtrA family protein [Ktedonospora formicarum]|uniref:GtrA/DPMS transmembrane domain-containing protein n=1 Tax=Ktedonospora formicarum TaxID=2778364 RepID=A0A8J3HW54_9CHLR|nr:GtrA family protein [Ktedonospora formicarum]GHO43111.1 hypothetical protein KSX_12740 [Ktedonospora formicarum]